MTSATEPLAHPSSGQVSAIVSMFGIGDGVDILLNGTIVGEKSTANFARHFHPRLGTLGKEVVRLAEHVKSIGQATATWLDVSKAAYDIANGNWSRLTHHDDPGGRLIAT